MHPDDIDRRINAALSRMRKPFRGQLKSVRRGRQVQVMQVLGLNGELLQEVELFQQFGHASRPPAGTMLMLLPIGGRTAHSVAIASELAGSQPELEAGESVLYSAAGDYVKVKNGRIVEVKAATEVVIDAPLATIKHDLTVLGNFLCAGNAGITGNTAIAGNTAVAGTVVAVGAISSATSVGDPSGTLAEVREVYDGHDHNIPGGVTALPNQLME